jgi:hypothetical protein
MTQLTPITTDQAVIAAEYMAKGHMHRFAKHMGAAFLTATPHHRDKILATFADLFALAFDTKRITEGTE